MQTEKMKISKGLFAQILVAILLSITFIGLGNWQLDRSHDVKQINIILPDKAEVSLLKIARVDRNLRPSAINRLVSVSGEYSQNFIAKNQSVKVNGVAKKSKLDVRILAIGNNQGILVARGIYERAPEISGELEISGRLYPRQTSDSTIGFDNELSRIDPALVVAKSNLQLFDGYIVAISELSQGDGEITAERIDAPQLRSKVAGSFWQHVSYVFVWWLMAILVLFAPFYNSLKERRVKDKVLT